MGPGYAGGFGFLRGRLRSAPRPGRVAPWPLSQGGGADVNREPAFSLIHNFQVKGFFRKDGINWSKQLYFIYLVKPLYFPIFFSYS